MPTRGVPGPIVSLRRACRLRSRLPALAALHLYREQLRAELEALVLPGPSLTSAAALPVPAVAPAAGAALAVPSSGHEAAFEMLEVFEDADSFRLARLRRALDVLELALIRAELDETTPLPVLPAFGLPGRLVAVRR